MNATRHTADCSALRLVATFACSGECWDAPQETAYTVTQGKWGQPVTVQAASPIDAWHRAVGAYATHRDRQVTEGKGHAIYRGSMVLGRVIAVEPELIAHHPACVKYGDDSGCDACNR